MNNYILVFKEVTLMLQINYTVKRISYFLLIVSLLITSFQIQPNKIVAEPLGADVTSILTNLLVNVTQGGLTISEGGEFSSDPIAVEISFGVPVEGDLPVPTEVVKKGDYALFTIEGFSITGDSSTIDLISNGIKLGTLEFSSVGENTQIKVVFDGEDEVFNGDFSEVSATFNANLEYVGNEQGSEDESYIVTILGKTFTVNVPAIPKVYTGVKTGVKRGDEIDWKIKVEVTQGEQNISISGLKLVDDLFNVGALIGDFSYNSVDDRTSATPFNPTFVLKEGSKYTLEFPEGVVSPVYVFFSTKIAEDFVTNGTKTITNTARLFDGEVEKVVVSDSVSFENRWIDKSSSNPEYIMEGGKLVAYVTWFITVNHMGASLPNARIIDVLDPKLQFVESEWYKKSGDNWVSLGSVNTVRPLGDTYYYPEPILNENIQLRVRTRVNPDENIGHKVISISNSARLEWGLDGEEQGVGSGSINVGIGTNPISKSAGNYDVKNHTIPWTVTVQQSDVSVSLRVLDLLVYGSTFDYGNVHSIEKALGAGSGLEDINKSHLDSIQNSLSPSFRQKYKPGSFTNSQGLTHTVYTLKDEDGIAIADLLVVSEGGNTINVSGGTLENPQSKSFNFETVVTDPTWYLSNSNRTVANTAMLFSANIKLNQRTANRSIAPRALFKDMLKADASVDPLNRKSDRTTNLKEGFNYEDKSVVFRLFVNQNGINATGGITTVDGQVVGNITIEDTLPSGWEFVDIEENVKFYLFNALGTPNSMTVGNQIISYENFLTSDFNTAGKATFTFTTLEEAYVIFVKARPTDATLDVYFNDNKTTTVTNTLRMTANEGVSVSDTQQIRIISQVLEKNMVKVENGVLRWTVSYRPFDIFQNIQDLDQYRLIDTLPIGLELYTDAFGNLDFSSGNFTVTEMVLTPTGYVASGPVFTVEQMQAAISYDFATRKLIFVIPNKDTSYQLNYKTMVTANSGSLTNSVVLEGVSLNSTNTSSSYIVATADASATMTRNGWVEVDKSNQNSSKLSGSEFTVFTEYSSLALRKGLTDSQGRLVLRGLPIGNYVLKETSAPTGYIVSEREYLVTVRNESGIIVTSIDGKTGADANKISVVNYQLGTSGDLTVSKKVTGNDADVEKAFEFILTMTGVSGDREFVKTSANGSVSFGSVIFNNGVSSFTIKHNESITIIGLPKDANYTLVEQVGDDYRASYSVNSGTVQEGKTYSGVIVVDSEEKIEFTNQRVGLIEIKKVDSLTGDVLEGVEFELYLGDMLVSSAITDVDGIVRFSNLALNTYRLVESKPLPGYLPFEDEIEIVIDKTKLLVQMTVSNIAKKSEISLDKSMVIYNGD